MLERVLITVSFIFLAAITAASAADSNAVCAGATQETGPDALLDPDPVTICVQNTSSSSENASDNSQSQEFLAAERYGKIILTALGKQLSGNEFLKKSSFEPLADAGPTSFFNDMSFGTFEPLAPIFDDFDNTPFPDEDVATWK